MNQKKLGFGTMRLPLLRQDDPKSIDLEQFKKMADLFIEKGFVYFDTAYPYHEEASEEAVKEAVVRRFPRDRFLLADKMLIMRVQSPEDYPRFFEEQIRRCGVDYFGLLNLHAVTGQKTNMYYQRFSMNHAKASECLKCGRCETICPQHIAIREYLEKFAALYEAGEEKQR